LRLRRRHRAPPRDFYLVERVLTDRLLDKRWHFYLVEWVLTDRLLDKSLHLFPMQLSLVEIIACKLSSIAVYITQRLSAQVDP
jgi:hypothetical protein